MPFSMNRRRLRCAPPRPKICGSVIDCQASWVTNIFVEYIFTPPPPDPIRRCGFTDGLVAHMLDLSGRGNENVKQICSTALNQVPPDMVELNDKMVKVLVSLLQVTGSSVIGDGDNAVSEPSVHDLRPWNLRSASITENPVNVKSSWVNDVCQDFEVRIFQQSAGSRICTIDTNVWELLCLPRHSTGMSWDCRVPRTHMGEHPNRDSTSTPP